MNYMSLTCSIASKQSDVPKINKIKNNEDPCMHNTINTLNIYDVLETNTNFVFI